MAIRIKTAEEINNIREGGKRLSAILDEVARAVVPGTTTLQLDALAERLIVSCGGIAVFKGYRIPEVPAPFPGSICTSVNDEIVHAIPRRERVLHEGDIMSIDIGMRWPADGHGVPGMGYAGRGLVTDMAVTIGIGAIAPQAQRLIRATKEALDIGIAAVAAGAHVGDISSAIEEHLKKNHLGVIRDLAGHGVGYELHEDPLIPNYGRPGTGVEMREGMVIAIEPMATLGGAGIVLDHDQWTFRTRDGSLAAHFEHTVAVTKHGSQILTHF